MPDTVDVEKNRQTWSLPLQDLYIEGDTDDEYIQINEFTKIMVSEKERTMCSSFYQSCLRVRGEIEPCRSRRHSESDCWEDTSLWSGALTMDTQSHSHLPHHLRAWHWDQKPISTRAEVCLQLWRLGNIHQHSPHLLPILICKSVFGFKKWNKGTWGWWKSGWSRRDSNRGGFGWEQKDYRCVNYFKFNLFSPFLTFGSWISWVIEFGLVLLARSTKDSSSIDSDVSEASVPRDPVLPKLQL